MYFAFRGRRILACLAAIGRTLAIGRTPDTAEVIDRMQRAIDGERLDEAPTIASRGFRLA